MFSIIGNKIKKIRKIRGLTQKELGVAVGFDEKSADVRIAQYESGVRKPKDNNISAIADALKVNPKMLGHPDIDFFVCLVQSMFWFDDLLALKLGKINGDYCFSSIYPKPMYALCFIRRSTNGIKSKNNIKTAIFLTMNIPYGNITTQFNLTKQ